jgi:hypothetical protein
MNYALFGATGAVDKALAPLVAESETLAAPISGEPSELLLRRQRKAYRQALAGGQLEGLRLRRVTIP